MSNAAEQQRFAATYRGSNPESPQNIYGRSASSRIGIKSISLINSNVVSVRYTRTITRGEDIRTTHCGNDYLHLRQFPDFLHRPVGEPSWVRG